MGYNCYQPMLQELRVVKGRRLMTRKPLLGRYLLIELLFDFYQHYSQLLSARGIERVLMIEGSPLCAREREIEVLREVERSYVTRKSFRKGQRVRALDGVFADIRGEYVEDDGGHDVVLFNLFNGLVPVTMPYGSLVAA